MDRLINAHLFFLTSIILLLPVLGSTQQNTQVKKQVVKGLEIETGYFFNGQPYAKVGTGEKILIQIEALSFDHVPPEGFILKMFVQQNKLFCEEFTVYHIGRKSNLPEGYSIDDMSKDYGDLIQSVFRRKVDVIGVSTGGQIGLSLSANFPQLVDNLVIISAAHKVSEEGKVLEKKAAEYFLQEKYGKTMATLIEVVYDKGFKRAFYKSMMRLAGASMLKDIEYPRDFQVELMADLTFDFKNRLKEIKVPTLVIVGQKDIGYSIDDVKVMADGIEHSELIIYDKYGHDLYPDNYQEVNENIIAFLSKDH